MKIAMFIATMALMGAQAASPLPGEMGSMSLATVANALANMADQVPVDSPILQSIREFITQMLADITSQHNVSQAELTDIAGYTTCTQTMVQSLSNVAAAAGPAATTLAPSTTATTTVHPLSISLQQCVAQLEAMNTSLTICMSEHTAAQSASDAVCMNFHYKTVVDAKAERCSETFAGSYEQYLERDVHILADYVSKKQNCSAFTKQTDSKASECDQLRETLFAKQMECSQIVVPTGGSSALPVDTAAEEAACSLYHAQMEVCSNYDSCFEAVYGSKQLEKSSAATLESSREAEWVSLQRMSCLVGAMAFNSNQTAAVQQCMSVAMPIYSTTHLQLVLPSPPTKHTCGPFQRPATCAQVQPLLTTTAAPLTTAASLRNGNSGRLAMR